MKTPLGILIALAVAAAHGLAADKTPAGNLSQVHFGSVVNGIDFKPDDLAGKVVVVEKWGTRCGPCIAFLPELAKIHKRYEKKGLEVVGMEVQNSKKEEITDLLDKARVKYPVVTGGSTPVNAGSIPHAHVFGTDGKLLWAGNPHDDGFLKAIRDGLRDVKETPASSSAGSAETKAGPVIATREWTNTDGKKIRAEVLRIEESQVIFRMNGSRELPYEIAKLSADDQKLIREAAEAR